MANVQLDIMEIFGEALACKSVEERSRYLDDACGTDPQVRERVEVLLCAHSDAGGFLGGQSPERATAVDQPVAERPGETIGRYKLLEEIGEGGMAVVFKAEQTEPVHRLVALKILKPGMDTRRVIARFEAERQALALMEHPSIAKVFDAGTAESGRPYFVMELVDGRPLTDYCDQHKVTTQQRLELFVQVCQAVQHAHQKGIIHRDLKPSNVLVTVLDGAAEPKIIDFGIAKAVHRPPGEAALTTGLGLIMGTPLYMSPEQAGTSGLNVDTRSDVYSLGVILYELLTGSTPFELERVKEAGYDDIRRIIREEEPPRPSARISTLGEAAAVTISTCRQTEPARLGRLLRGDLDWVVMRALEKDAARRYQTPADFAQDIQRHLASEPIEARPPSLFDHAAKWSRRHRPLVWSAALLLLLSTIGSVVSAVLIGGAYEEKNQQLTATERAEEFAKKEEGLAKEQEQLAKEQKVEAQNQRDTATRNLYLAQMRLAQQDLASGQVPRLHEMLDSYLPRPGQPDLRGWEWYYLLSQCHGELLTFRGHNGAVNALAWSPDGQQIASSDDRTIKIWNPVTGKTIRTFTGHNDNVGWLAWSTRGHQLASLGGGAIKVWDMGSGRELRTILVPAGRIADVAWNPDLGRFVARTADGAVRILHAGTGETIRVLPIYTSGGPFSWSPDGQQLAFASDRAVNIWDDSKGKFRTLSGHKVGIGSAAWGPDDGFGCVAWSPDGRRVAAGSYGAFEIKVWDAATGIEVTSLKGLDSTVMCVAWSPDGSRLASGGYAGTVKINNAASGELVATLRGHTKDCKIVAWSPNGQRVASASDDGTVRIWDATAEPEARVLRGQVRSISAVAWSPNSRQLVGGGGEGRLQVWDVVTGKTVRTWSAHTGLCSAVAWSLDGKHIASGSEDGDIKIWNAETVTAIGEFEGHKGLVRALCWNPGGNWLASAGDDTTMRIWDVASSKERHTFNGHIHPVHGLAWSPDGGRIASAAHANLDFPKDPIKIWQPASGQNLLSLQHADDVAYVHGPVTWSPDGCWVASAGRVIEVWNAADGKLAYRLYGHNGTVNALVWHPHGNRLASAAEEHTIKIWDLETRQELLTLSPQTAYYPAALAWSPDGMRLAAVNNDEVRIWDASVGYRMASGAEYQYDRSCRLSTQGRNDEAIEVLKKLADDWPERPEYKAKLANFHEASGLSHLRRAESSSLQGEIDKAIAELTEALRLDARRADLYLNRSQAFGRKGEIERQIADLSECIRLDPNCAVALASRGAAYQTKGEHDKAIADFNEVIRLDPNSADAHNNRGRAYRSKHEDSKASADFEEAMRLNHSNDVAAILWRAWADSENREYDKAIADYTEAVRLAPQHAFARYQRVLATLAAGRPDEYRKALAEMIQRFSKSDDPDTARFVVLACVIVPDSGADLPSVMALAEKAMRRKPGSRDLLGSLGTLLYRNGSYGQSIDRLSEANRLIRDPSEIAPSSPAYNWFFLAMAHHRLGHTAEAGKWLDKAAQWTETAVRESKAGVLPREYLSWQRLLVWKHLRQETEKLIGAKAAPLVDPPEPQTAETHHKHGCELARKGDLDGALTALRAAIRLDPNSRDYFLERGQVYAEKGDMGEAIADFREVMRLDSTSSGPWLLWLSHWLPAVMRGTEKPNRVIFATDMNAFKSDGTKETLEETPTELHSATDANAALLLAEVHWRLDHKELARRWFDKAVAWMEKNKTEAEKLREYQAGFGISLLADMCNSRAMAYVQAGENDKAITDFRQVLRARSEIDPAWLQWVSCWLPFVTRGAENLPGIIWVSDMPWVRSTCGYGRPEATRDGYLGGHWLCVAGFRNVKGIGTHAFAGATPADVVLDVAGRQVAVLKTQVGLNDNGAVQFQVLIDGKVKYQTHVMYYGAVEPISLDVTGAKEIVLRVLNDGGNGNYCDSVGWGYARFIQAGAEDPLEEPPAELHSATDANAALFLAEVHWRLDHKEIARHWFKKAVAWMEKNKPAAEKLREYQAEAGVLLGIPETPSPAKQQPKKPNHQDSNPRIQNLKSQIQERGATNERR